MSPTEQALNNAIRLLTVYMIESKFAHLKSDVFSDGAFYVINITIRKVEE